MSHALKDQPRDRRTMTPLAIVGMGCLFPKAAGPTSFWANILAGVDATGEIPPTHWRPDDYFSPDPAAPDRTYARRGGFLEPVEFEPLRYGLNPNSIEATDTTQLLGLMVAEYALRDAGYALDDGLPGKALDRDRTSCILGVTGALELVVSLGARLGHPHWRRALREAGIDESAAEQIVARIAESYVPWQEHSFPGLLGNVAAGRIANRFDLGGTNCVVDAACASSLSAIHMAAMELELGRADTVIAGGLDTFNDIFMYMCFSKTPALSPTGDCRPYSDRADGTLLGEGLGVVVLKRLDDARREGDRIYAVIKGLGSSSDGRGNAIYAPSAEGQMRALRAAYRAAGISPATIELIEGHGTGTKVGDAVELEALCRVFREARPDGRWCAVGSVKSMIGHTKAAAGVAGLMKATLALYHKVLPPTIKVTRPAPACESPEAPIYVNTESRPWMPRRRHPRRAGVSAFGFGGSNFHCVLEEATPQAAEVFWDGRDQVIPFSGDDRSELVRQLEGFCEAVRRAERPWQALRALAADCRQRFEPHAAQRLVLVARQQEPERQSVPELLDEALAWLARPETARRKPAAMNGATAVAGKGEFFFDDRPAGQLALLFPGQGSQRVGMLRDLACRFPMLLETLAEMNEVFGPAGDDGNDGTPRLSDLVFPPPVFDDKQREHTSARLRDTRVAQPALAAIEWGAYRVLRHFGIRAEAVAGHSFGELVALAAAGCIEPADLFRLAVERGRLMAEAAATPMADHPHGVETAAPDRRALETTETDAGRRASERNGGNRGAMLAVAATADEVEAVVAREKLPVHLANRNAPRQVVYSGDREAIERLERVLREHQVSATRLAVSAAFHSPAMQGAARQWITTLEQVNWRGGSTPVFANVTGRPYPAAAGEARRLLGEQLVRPVRFVETIENMYSSGIRIFVEVGPATVLCGLVRQILGERPHAVVALDGSRGRRPGTYDLALALGQLAALGQRLDWTAWDPAGRSEAAGDARKDKRRRTLTIALCGANYRKPRGSDGEATRAAPTSGTGREGQLPPRAEKPPAQMPQPSERLEPRAASSAADSDAAASPRAMREKDTNPQQRFVSGSTMHDPAHEEMAHRSASSKSDSAPPAASRSSTTPGPIASHTAGVPAIERGAPTAMDEALRFSQQAIVTFQKLQEQTAALHRQYLEGQEIAQRNLAELIGQQQRLLLRLSGIEPQVESAPGGQALSAAAAAPILNSPTESEPRARSGVEETPSRAGQAAAESDVRSPREAATGKETTGTVAFEPPEPTEARSSGRDRADEPATTAPKHAESVLPVLLEVVAEKTGYPTDVLDVEMGLDDDLGIDSIKRVEIFSELQERLPHLPPIGAEELNAWSTLREIADFLDGRLASNDHANGSPTAGVEPGSSGNSNSRDNAVPTAGVDERSPDGRSDAARSLAHLLLEVVAEKTGYPTEMLELDMQLDAELGIDSIKRVEILSELKDRVPSLPEIGSEGLGTVETLRDIVNLLGSLEGLEAADASGNAFPQTDQPNTDVPSTSSTTPATSDGTLTEVLLEVVAEKTGYPTEMLELDMQLDAELGIDSIKRVEIFSELQERLPDMPPVEADRLGALQTLREIVDHLGGSSPDPTTAKTAETRDRDDMGTITDNATGETSHDALGKPAEDAAAGTSPSWPHDAPPAEPETQPATARATEVSSTLEHYAVGWQWLDEATGLARQAVELASDGAVWVSDDRSGLSERIVAALRERGLAAELVSDLPDGPPSALSALILVAPPAADIEDLTQAFRWLKLAERCWRRGDRSEIATAGNRLLASVSQIDGCFGLPELQQPAKRKTPRTTAANPIGGGLAGLVKTAAAEWTEVNCRAVDVPPVGNDLDRWAERIVEHLLVEGPIELGISEHGIGTPALLPVEPTAQSETTATAEADWAEQHSGPPRPLEAGDLVVVSGGARGVTAEAVVALAEAFGPRLLLLGRSELSDNEPDWLRDLDDEAAIKAAIARHGEAKTPREIERVFRQVVCSREIRATLARVEAAGATAVYRSVDICDGPAVRRVVDEARQRLGPVRGIVHGAGILADRLIGDLDVAAFERVVSTKVEGLRHLLAAAQDDALRVLAVFSSSTARFGRKGQAAYAAANEALNKMAQCEARRRPGCRVCSINWGPWDGGMVSEALKRQFAREGIHVIPLRDGARHLVEQLRRSNGAVESVVAGRGSGAALLGRPQPDCPTSREAPVSDAAGVRWSLAFERRVSVETCPVLRSHVLNHRAVLPMALMVEWLAHGALHDNFSLRFHGFDDLQVFKGVRLDGDESVELGVWVAPPQTVSDDGERDDARVGEMLRVDVELRCGDLLHARGRIVLAESLPEAPIDCDVPMPSGGQTRSGDLLDGDPYADGRLFHGPELQGIRRVHVCDDRSIVADVATAPAPAGWLERPLRSTWLADPLALDAAFQLMVLWTGRVTGHPSLPMRAEGYRQFVPVFPAEGVRVVGRVLRHTEHALTATLEWYAADDGRLVARMDRYHAVIDGSLHEAFARNRLLEGVHG